MNNLLEQLQLLSSGLVYFWFPLSADQVNRWGKLPAALTFSFKVKVSFFINSTYNLFSIASLNHIVFLINNEDFIFLITSFHFDVFVTWPF